MQSPRVYRFNALVSPLRSMVPRPLSRPPPLQVERGQTCSTSDPVLRTYLLNMRTYCMLYVLALKNSTLSIVLHLTQVISVAYGEWG